MALEKYRQKRIPERTPEPFGKARDSRRDAGGPMFVIQKHAARRLHYDFRLEMEGVLRSWAVPKGPSLDPGRQAAGRDGRGPSDRIRRLRGDDSGRAITARARVIVWDRGEYRPIDPQGDAADAVRAGKLDLELHGFKLRGAYTLVRTRGMAEPEAIGRPRNSGC